MNTPAPNTPQTSIVPITSYKPTGTTYKPCFHDGDEVIWKHGGTEFVIADKEGCTPYADVNLIIDLNRNLKTNPKLVEHGPERFMALNKYMGGQAEVVQLDWPDMQAVGAPIEFWQHMLEELPKGRVMIACHGGHGRSGTCLAALMVASGMDSDDAIDLIRDKHCKKAVETKKQEDYLDWLSGKVAKKTVPFKTTSDPPFEYCVHCGRDFKEPSMASDTCMDCEEDPNWYENTWNKAVNKTGEFPDDEVLEANEAILAETGHYAHDDWGLAGMSLV